MEKPLSGISKTIVKNVNKIFLIIFNKLFLYKICIALVCIVIITQGLFMVFQKHNKIIEAGFSDIPKHLDPGQNGIGAALDPNQNGLNDAFATAFDPKKNGFGKMFDPNQNGFSKTFTGISNSIFNYVDSEYNAQIDNTDNVFILLSTFFKKTLNDFFIDFLGSYWACFMKFLKNLSRCIIYYSLQSIGYLLYLPFKLLIWMFCLQSYEKSVWDGIYEIDDGFACFTGFHFAKFPEGVIQDCYTCKVKDPPVALPRPKMKSGEMDDLLKSKTKMNNFVDSNLNPMKNGVFHGLDPNKNGVAQKFKDAFNPNKDKSFASLGKSLRNVSNNVNKDIASGFTEVFTDLFKRIEKVFKDLFDKIKNVAEDTTKKAGDALTKFFTTGKV